MLSFVSDTSVQTGQIENYPARGIQMRCPILRRTMPAKPTRPLPSSRMLDGSGVAVVSGVTYGASVTVIVQSVQAGSVWTSLVQIGPG
jgi:hypothetical protein